MGRVRSSPDEDGPPSERLIAWSDCLGMPACHAGCLVTLCLSSFDASSRGIIQYILTGFTPKGRVPSETRLPIYLSYLVESYTEAPRMVCRSRRKNNFSSSIHLPVGLPSRLPYRAAALLLASLLLITLPVSVKSGEEDTRSD